MTPVHVSRIASCPYFAAKSVSALCQVATGTGRVSSCEVLRVDADLAHERDGRGSVFHAG